MLRVSRTRRRSSKVTNFLSAVSGGKMVTRAHIASKGISTNSRGSSTPLVEGDRRRVAFKCRLGFNMKFLLKVLGGLGLIPSFFFTFRAYTDNTFLSPLVRLQKERKQKVVTTGVYAIVRHPMYLGALSMFIATPLLLGSWYAALM